MKVGGHAPPLRPDPRPTGCEGLRPSLESLPRQAGSPRRGRASTSVSKPAHCTTGSSACRRSSATAPELLGLNRLFLCLFPRLDTEVLRLQELISFSFYPCRALGTHSSVPVLRVNMPRSQIIATLCTCHVTCKGPT